jgi:hypothetical protein
MLTSHSCQTDFSTRKMASMDASKGLDEFEACTVDIVTALQPFQGRTAPAVKFDPVRSKRDLVPRSLPSASSHLAISQDTIPRRGKIGSLFHTIPVLWAPLRLSFGLRRWWKPAKCPPVSERTLPGCLKLWTYRCSPSPNSSVWQSRRSWGGTRGGDPASSGLGTS